MVNTRKNRLISPAIGWCLALFLIVAGCSKNTPTGSLSSQNEGTPLAKPGTATVWYVRADNSATGAGTFDNPFNSLTEAVAASGSGDVIRIIPSKAVLEGGITLKDGQKLIGLGGDPQNLPPQAVRAAITCSESGVSAITLANDNEVANIQILDTNQGNGVLASSVQNAYVHNCLFTRVGGTSIGLITGAGVTSTGHVVEDCTITGAPEQAGSAQAGIYLTTYQNGGNLEARIERVTLTDLTGSNIRAGIIFRNNAQPGTAGGSLTAVLHDVTVDNVGGNEAVWAWTYGGSQNVTLDGCRIVNSSGEPGFVIAPVPEYIGPFGPFPAHQGQYIIENSDITGATVGVQVAPNPRTDSNVIVDLGGGSLGSVGMNRLYDNDVDLDIGAYVASATSNWWGDDLTPVITTRPGVDPVPTDPILTVSPR